MPLETDLVSYWPLDTNSNDAWGSNNGTDSNVIYSSGSADFNGTSSKIDLGNTLNFGTNNVTAAGWAYYTSIPGAASAFIVGKGLTSGGGTGYAGFQLSALSGMAQWWVGGGGTYSGPSEDAIVTGQWYHVVGVRSGTSVLLYVDGVLVDTVVAGSVHDMTSTLNAAIGAWRAATGTWYTVMDGSLDDVAVWERALSAVEIAAVYAAGRGNLGTLLPDAKLRGMIGSAVHDVPASYLKLEGMIGSVVHDSPPTTAVVPDIAGPVLVPATFDGSGSTAISYYNWSWVSVPGGSSVGPVGIIPLPDGGGVGPPDMTNNAVLYHCEEVAGTTGTDTSGSTNDATLTTITVGQPGKVGSYAWQYTATGSKAVFAASVPIAATDYTIAFWFKGVAPSSTWRVGARASGADYHIIVESGSNRLGLYSGGFKDSGATLAVGGDWRHLVSVGTGGDTLFYVDGALAGTVVGTQSTDAIDSIGNKPSGGMRFADYIDEAAIWTRALSAAEILNIYNLQTGVLGTASTYAFTPDIAGTYTINLAVSASENTNADAVITAPSAGGGGLQGETLQGDILQGDILQGTSLQ